MTNQTPVYALSELKRGEDETIKGIAKRVSEGLGLDPLDEVKQDSLATIAILQRQAGIIENRLRQPDLSVDTIAHLNSRMREIRAQIQEIVEVERTAAKQVEYRLLKALRKASGVYRLPAEADQLYEQLKALLCDTK